MLFTGQIYFNPSNHRYMAAGDIKSVLCLTLNIHSIFKLKKIPHKFSDEAVISQDLRENIITIGGPKFNTVTRVMIDKYNQMIPSFPAKFNGNSIYINAVNARGETFQKQFCLKRHNGTLIDDYGLLIRGINPFDDTNSSLSWVIAGSGSNGVIASVDQMSHFIHGFQVRFRRLYKFLYSGAIGIVVVKANFFEGEYVSSNPVFYAVYKPSNRPFLKKKFNWEFRNLDI